MNRWLLSFTLVICLYGSAATAETLTLSDCLALAREQNPTLKTLAVTPMIAQQRIKESRSVYQPQVDLQAGYSWQKDPQQVVIGGASEPTQNRDYAHMSLSADQLLYDFGRSSGRVAAATATARAAGLSYAGSVQDVFLQTVAAYFRILSAQHLLQAARDETAGMEEHRRVAQALFDEGVVTRNDVLQAEVRLAASLQLELARQGELDNAWQTLNYLIGRNPDTRSELQTEPLFDQATLPGVDAIADRPELKAEQQLVAAAREQVRQTRGSYWPELFAHLGADYVDNNYVKEQTIYSATLGLKVSLFDGAARNARLQESLQSLNQERRRQHDLFSQFQVEYNKARNDAEVASRRISVAQTAISQAEENLRINRDRYREHAGTATEVLDAQTLLTQTRTNFYRAQFDYQVAIARVRRAAGSL